MRPVAALLITMTGLSLSAHGVELKDFLALPQPTPTQQISYGAAQSQGIDVFLPAGAGPHPVAIMIHGGCWSDFPGAGREQVRALAADWARRGVAVWSVGYRRANETGGGYPNLYLDVATAVDRLRSEAPRLGIDPTRSVLAGHSAGGHLALWAASRTRLPAASPLRRAGHQPLSVRGVVSIAGVGDLAAFAPHLPGSCGRGILQRLMGSGPDPYADVSPARLGLPESVGSVVMLSATEDGIVPLRAARDYRSALPAEAAARVRLRDVTGAGHFDLVTPGTPAFEAVFEEVRRLLG
ncbi:MAG: alpha/beta hydrolase [Polaromonas sp.]|nr:alpha/beta hydrolase [Polaromonas sp.]